MVALVRQSKTKAANLGLIDGNLGGMTGLMILTAVEKTRAAVAKEVGTKIPMKKQPPARIKIKSTVST